MAGIDTVRGIGYQQAQAVAEAVALLDNPDAGALRVEGADDIVDLEVLTSAGSVLIGKQIKIRADDYTWGKAELVAVLRRWAELTAADVADFEFVTDGRLGPTGEGVATALGSAANGDTGELADLIGEARDSLACRRLQRARIRRDPVGTGALLLRVEREVASMLPSPRTESDVRAESQAAVDRLFRVLFDRAGHPSPDARVLDRKEIADVLGVPAEQREAHRWPGKVRDIYLAAAAEQSLPTVTTTVLQPLDWTRPRLRSLGSLAADGMDTADTVSLLERGAVPLLAGTTGSGKSTVCLALVRDAAAQGRVVVVSHAEAYLPGRLDALAADALSGLYGELLPAATGRQALADHGVTLVIDGVSEVPEGLRDALAEDLRVQVAAQRGAAVILVGRDIAVLRSVLPTKACARPYLVAALDREHRHDLARRLLASGTGGGAEGSAGYNSLDTAEHVGHHGADRVESGRLVHQVVAQVEGALGDAAGNPMLFTMATVLLGEGIAFTNRAAMYEKFVERLAERSGTTNIVAVARTLGIAFAHLLDEGRRYTDPYQWEALLDLAVEQLNSRAVDPAAVDAASRRSGIVAPMGFAQTVIPIHDSFADYLAGAAHAGGQAALPDTLGTPDEQRVSFTAEINGVHEALAHSLARDLPFLAVRLAGDDRRRPDDTWPEQVQALLGFLLPNRSPGVALWRPDPHGSRVLAFLRETQPRSGSTTPRGGSYSATLVRPDPTPGPSTSPCAAGGKSSITV